MSSWFRVETAFTPAPAAMAIVAGAVAALCLTPSAQAQIRSNAQAEQSRTLAARAPDRTLPPTGRYVSESGESFVFDRSGPRPLFRFERRAETWVLRPSPAPRGDIIYRNDAGDQILRVTPNGGMTLYSVRASSGSPASMAGPAPALTQPLLGPILLARLMVQRSAMMSQALGRTVIVQLDGEEDEALCVDALLVATEAVIRMAGSPTMRAQLNGLRSISITEGRASGVTFTNGDLRVTVRPHQGVSGRPSSARIIRTVSSK